MSIDKDTAEREFNRFAELMDLDLDTSHMDEDDLAGFEKQKRTIVRAIETGHVVINDEGEPTVKLKRPRGDLTEITFHEPEGSTFLAMDQKKKTQDVSKMYSMLQDMADLQPGDLAKLKNRDLRVIQSIALLFLG